MRTTIIKCETCGKEKEVKLYALSKGYGRFCSRKCAGQDPKRKEKQVKCICKYCSKEFYKSRARVAHGEGQYCSWKCYTLSGVSATNRKPTEKTITTIVCKYCGVTTSVRRWGEPRLFCSTVCYHKYRKEHVQEYMLPQEVYNAAGKKGSITIKQQCNRKKENNSNWHGGSSFKEYPIYFDGELKELIRQRADYKCMMCGAPEIECMFKLSVHHIDYNKENCDPKNLVALCINCHRKTLRNRNYWKYIFTELMTREYQNQEHQEELSILYVQ